ncbi:MAG TPA: hypothetical protein VF026_12095 [Ktedonobacteraceae bacterium]
MTSSLSSLVGQPLTWVPKLLPVYERVLGRNHPETLRARRVLASWAEMASLGRSTPLLERSGSCWKA